MNRYSQIDTIIHFAADCTSTRCYGDPCEATENNVLAFIDFLEASRIYGKLRRFVHISTDEVAVPSLARVLQHIP